MHVNCAPCLGTILLAAMAVVSCRAAGASSVSLRSQPAAPRPPLVQPGAPGEPVRVITAEKATDLSRVEHTPADVKFMQGMIGHHAQAVEMVALLRSRTARRDMQLLGQRIDLSQADEIKMMQEWLRGRGQSLPDPHAHHIGRGDADAGHAHGGGNGAAGSGKGRRRSTGSFSRS